MTYSRLLSFITSSILGSLVLLFSSPVIAADKPVFMFDGVTMNGWIQNYRCRSPKWKPVWEATIVNGNVEGYMVSSGVDNEPKLMSMPQHFSLPIAKDGSFGASSGKGPHRLWLRWWAPSKSGYGSRSSGPNKRKAHLYSGRKGKYHFVSGQVLENGDVNLKLKWGTADNQGTCNGAAYFKVGKDSKDTLNEWLSANKDLCSQDLDDFSETITDKIEDLHSEKLIASSFFMSKFKLKRLYKDSCS